MGEWVPGYELATREVGGSEGLRRLRYAEQDGWIIEKRRVPGETYWEYRLLGHRDDS